MKAPRAAWLFIGALSSWLGLIAACASATGWLAEGSFLGFVLACFAGAVCLTLLNRFRRALL